MRLGSRYQLGRRIARGGFGEVFSGFLLGGLGFRRPVAIKVLPDPNPVELALACRLCDPNIVEVFDVFVADGKVYLVMELAEAGSAGDLLAKGRLPVAAAAHIADSVLGALEAAHAAVVAHRDVTPHNVLLWSDGRAKLADFGIAKAVGVDAPATKAGLVKGKLAYLSPEQVRQDGVDGRTDLWSLGVVLYELVSGRRPYGRRSGSDAEALAAIACASPPDLTTLGVPGWFEAFLGGLLAPDPDERWPSASAARAVLRSSRVSWLEGQDDLAAALASEIASHGRTRNLRPKPPSPPSSPAPLAPKREGRAVPRRPTVFDSLRARSGLSLLATVGLSLVIGIVAGLSWAGQVREVSHRLAPPSPVVRIERRIAPIELEPARPPPSKQRRTSPKTQRARRRRSLGPAFFEPGGTLEVRETK